jgi:tetratricopeptide (TPR) repeat protein
MRIRVRLGVVLAAAFALAGMPPCFAQPAPAWSDGFPTVQDRRSCEASLAAARRALHDRKYEEAVRLYSAVAPRNCPGAELHVAFNRGMALHHLGRLEEAMRDFDVAVKFDPGDRHSSAVLHNNRCYSLTKLGRAAEALPDCDKAVSLSPRQNEVYLSTRAVAYVQLGRYQDALRDFDAALQSAPRKADALYSRGIVKRHLGMPGADADIAAALALDPALANPRGR